MNPRRPSRPYRNRTAPARGPRYARSSQQQGDPFGRPYGVDRTSWRQEAARRAFSARRRSRRPASSGPCAQRVDQQVLHGEPGVPLLVGRDRRTRARPASRCGRRRSGTPPGTSARSRRSSTSPGLYFQCFSGRSRRSCSRSFCSSIPMCSITLIDRRAVVDELLLERVDRVVAALDLLGRRQLAHPADQHVFVVRAVEDADHARAAARAAGSARGSRARVPRRSAS